MNSYLIKQKKYQEIVKFLSENQHIYPNSLKDFLSCSYKQAYRILCEIKEKYNIKTKFVSAKTFQMYLDEE